jgi:hypothetical protein
MKSETLLSLVAVAGLVATPLPAAAQQATDVFKPAGQWALDYGDDYCRLSRSFSDGKGDLSLAFERIDPGPSARLILISDAIKPFRSADEIGWHFTPSDPPRKARYMHSVTGDGKQYYNLGPFTVAPFAPPSPGATPAPPPPFDRAKEQAAAKGMTGMTLDSGLTIPMEVDTGDLAAPVAALQTCADDLAKSWGLDPAKLQGEMAAAIPEGGGIGWLPQGTIGFADFAKLGGGSNQVRLMVDATGKATSCTIHWPTLDATTNDKICKALMANAKFTPAKDAAGQAMAGYWVASPMQMMPPFRGGRGR